MDVPPRIALNPHCLIFFMDETGHEELSDPSYPVFGFGGCAIMAAVSEINLRRPWREMKAQHFGGADMRLHASGMRLTDSQAQAAGSFFQTRPFLRFALTVTRETAIPAGMSVLAFLRPKLRELWVMAASRCSVAPVEIALFHEASQRLDPLIQEYFGSTIFKVNHQRVPTHNGFIEKRFGVEGLEIADFIAHAAGRQALCPREQPPRKDFASIFEVKPEWTVYERL